MRNYYLSLIITGLAMLTTGVHAQNSIHRVLKEIEGNNKTLQANWISLPGRSPPTAKGIKANAEVKAVINMGFSRSREP